MDRGSHQRQKSHRPPVRRLRVIADQNVVTEEPRLVVAVSSSYRYGTVQGAVIRALADAATDRGLASVFPLDTLPRLPHFDISAGCAGVSPALVQTGAMLGQADAVMFCVAEYAEGLPAIVGNLLEWAIAGGFLSDKRVGWVNVASGSNRARAAHESLERTLRFAGADIALRANIPLPPGRVSPAGRLTDRAAVADLVSALERLLPISPTSTDVSHLPEGTLT
jgi:NAD(P)H-dependent FMN reductase